MGAGLTPGSSEALASGSVGDSTELAEASPSKLCRTIGCSVGQQVVDGWATDGVRNREFQGGSWDHLLERHGDVETGASGALEGTHAAQS